MCCCCTMVKPRKKERKKCPLTLTTTNHQIPIACGHPSKYLKAKRDTILIHIRTIQIQSDRSTCVPY